MKKLNNKGFSLVELIIVIAIMAILVGVVGTQVIPYLENSRKAKDQQVFSAWNTAAVSAYSTEAGNLQSTSTYIITVAGTGDNAVTISATVDGTKYEGNLLTTFKSLAGIPSDFCFKKNLASKAGKSVTEVKITIAGDGASEGIKTEITAGENYSFDTIENK